MHVESMEISHETPAIEEIDPFNQMIEVDWVNHDAQAVFIAMGGREIKETIVVKGNRKTEEHTKIISHKFPSSYLQQKMRVNNLSSHQKQVVLKMWKAASISEKEEILSSATNISKAKLESLEILQSTPTPNEMARIMHLTQWIDARVYITARRSSKDRASLDIMCSGADLADKNAADPDTYLTEIYNNFNDDYEFKYR